jgi:hypothetical protein
VLRLGRPFRRPFCKAFNTLEALASSESETPYDVKLHGFGLAKSWDATTVSLQNIALFGGQYSLSGMVKMGRWDLRSVHRATDVATIAGFRLWH